MPLPGDHAPPGRDWLTHQLHQLRRDLDELRAARPADTLTIWVPVPLTPTFHDSQGSDTTNTDPTLPVSACNGGTVWAGRIGLVSHPHLTLTGSFGRTTGTTATPTYRLHINGTELDAWTQTTHTTTTHGPYDITAWLGQTTTPITLSLSAIGTSTDRIATNILGCWIHT